ncbi:MAG: MBL fold metallo-hydrolase [Opitutaceae bacterium]|nr:MBL fold metallo-hydrolase [Opitutaceae bacterium]
MIVRIRCAISNCYLVIGERPLLVDTGAPGDLRRILRALSAHQIEPGRLSLILLTHGHSDHAGCTAELKRRSQAPVALHAADVPLAQAGRNGVLAPTSPLARLARPFVDEPFEPFVPDLAFHDGFDLAPYGVRGRVLATPGHTPGSASVVLASGEALIGDVLRGSLVVPNAARQHFFCGDPELNLNSIARLTREGLLRCHPGLFGSFPGSALPRFMTPIGEVMDLSEQPAPF